MALPNPQPGSPATTPGEFNNSSPTSNTGATNVLGYPPGSLSGTNSTSTSNVTGFLPDILMICQEACERAGYDYTNAYALRSAKRSIEFLTMEWSNKGLNLWTLDEQTTPLIGANPGPYLMPPDTMDLISPAINYVSGGNGSPSQVLDITIARQDFDTYFAIPNKASVGRPSLIFVQRLAAAPQFYVWQVPSVSDVATYQYKINWWRMRRMQNTGYATNGVDMPYRFIPALTAGVAWQMATKKKQKDLNLIQLLKLQYDEALLDAKYEDRDRSSIYIAPHIGRI